VSGRLGPYAPLSATYAADDAVIEVGEAAELLYVRALAFCASSDSDGYLSDAQLVRYVGVGMRDAVKRADRLVEVGLWERHPGGYTVRAWLKWNKPVEEREGVKRRDRERKSRRTSDITPDDPPTGVPKDSGRIPDGFPAESSRSPGGIPEDSLHASARAPARAPQSTPLQSTVPPSAGAVAPCTGPSENGSAQTLVAEWIDRCPERPPGRVIGQVAKELGVMLHDDAIPYPVVRAGLQSWHEKRLNPSALASVVHEVRQGPRRMQSTTDDRVASGLALADRYAREGR
jgi:hypothetical protein